MRYKFEKPMYVAVQTPEGVLILEKVKEFETIHPVVVETTLIKLKAKLKKDKTSYTGDDAFNVRRSKAIAEKAAKAKLKAAALEVKEIETDITK